MTTEDEVKISQAAVKEMRPKEAYLKTKYADVVRFPPQKDPASIFMAGSPGAGKTEFSRGLLRQLGNGAVRIDPDEIRTELSQYKPGNAHLFQSAVTIGTDAVFYETLRNNQSFILDGTLQKYDTALRNVTKVLEKRKQVDIFYLYQDPEIAWRFTQAREKIEGRNIGMRAFVNALFLSKENVDKLKQVFGEKVLLHLVKKDYKHDIEQYLISVENIDNHLRFQYSKEDLERRLHEQNS